MRNREELNKMSKKQIIELVCANELLPRIRPNSLRSITLGTVGYIAAVGRELADKPEHGFKAIIRAKYTTDGSLVVVLPVG
jgi:hypothetical protein